MGDEERPALGQFRIAEPHVPLVLVLVVEEIDLDDGVRRRQPQISKDLVTELAQLVKKGSTRLERDVTVEDKLRDPVCAGLAGQRGRGNGRARRFVAATLEK